MILLLLGSSTRFQTSIAVRVTHRRIDVPRHYSTSAAVETVAIETFRLANDRSTSGTPVSDAVGRIQTELTQC